MIKLSYHLFLNGCTSAFLHFESSIAYQPEELISRENSSETVIVETPNAIFIVSEQTWYQGRLGAKYADEWRIVAEAYRNSLLALFKKDGFDISFESGYDSPRTYRLVLEKRKKSWVETIH